MFQMELHHALQINGADDVHVVQNEWGITGSSAAGDRLPEKPCGVFQAAAGVEQRGFTGNLNPHAEIVMPRQILDDQIGEMMHVDDHFVDTKFAQAGQRDFEQGAACDFHQRLGAIIGKRPQSRAEASGQDHGFHAPAFSSSR